MLPPDQPWESLSVRKGAVVAAIGKRAAATALKMAHQLGYFEAACGTGRGRRILQGKEALRRAGIFNEQSDGTYLDTQTAELLSRSRCFSFARHWIQSTCRENEGVYANMLIGFAYERREIKAASISTSPLKYRDIQRDLLLIFHLIRQNVSRPSYVTVTCLIRALQELDILPNSTACMLLWDDIEKHLFGGVLPEGPPLEWLMRCMLPGCGNHAQACMLAGRAPQPWREPARMYHTLLKVASRSGMIQTFHKALGKMRHEWHRNIPMVPKMRLYELQCLAASGNWEIAVEYFLQHFYRRGAVPEGQEGGRGPLELNPELVHLYSRASQTLFRMCSRFAKSPGDEWEGRAERLMHLSDRAVPDGEPPISPLMQVYAATKNGAKAKQLAVMRGVAGTNVLGPACLHHYAVATQQSHIECHQELEHTHSLSMFAARYYTILAAPPS
eukprot:TRINITY_DN57954_c0_g1_i1.p1 TRINITY_DN57954_c0_g1~~TRINITY_DN57954_c0_g1_i1.p1  ORF type:complete len:444 (+),score=88.30 TRINITY_DN57954_c0_g1_i1:84-1415(+)